MLPAVRSWNFLKYGFCKKLAEDAGPSVRHLKDELLNQKVVATDATTVTVNGVQSYIRNFSVVQTVVYHAMKSKIIDEMKGLLCGMNRTRKEVIDQGKIHFWKNG